MRSTRARTVQARAISSPAGGVADPLHEIEQDFRVGQSVLDDFDRAGVADDFGEFGQPRRAATMQTG